MQERGPAAYIAEFIGAFTLVFAVVMVVVGYVPPANPTTGVIAFQDFAVVGLVHAFVLFFLIQTLAVISGAHFNPAITVGLAAIRQIRLMDAGIYIVMQLAGGTLGALFAKQLVAEIPGRAVHYGAPAVNGTTTTLAAMSAEGVGTFFLVWAVVGVAVNPAGLKEWSGFAIGATLGFAVMIIGPLTGGSFNPARAFGPALVAHFFDGSAGKWLLVYVLAAGIGAVLAAAGYFWLFIQPGKKGVAGMEPVG